MMGARQESWLQKQLTASNNRGAKWRVVGSQVLFNRLKENGDIKYNIDGWDVSILVRRS